MRLIRSSFPQSSSCPGMKWYRSREQTPRPFFVSAPSKRCFRSLPNQCHGANQLMERPMDLPEQLLAYVPISSIMDFQIGISLQLSGLLDVFVDHSLVISAHVTRSSCPSILVPHLNHIAWTMTTAIGKQALRSPCKISGERPHGRGQMPKSKDAGTTQSPVSIRRYILI